MTQQIQLSVEEALEYNQLDSQLAGFVAGANAMADHLRRHKVQQLISSRPPAKETGENKPATDV